MRILLLLLLPILLLALAGCTPEKTKEQKEGTLFSLLSPEQSNIHFNNQLEDSKAHNIMIYSNYYGGAGVGIGDINNDGLADIYFAGNLVADKIYLNKGNLEFEDITTSAGIIDNGGWSSGVIMADVNEDGWLDIYVTRELYDDQPELRKNKLYINNGDQTFTEKAETYNIADSERTRHATFLDYDKDGDYDLFLLNQPPNPGDYSKYYDTDLLQKQYRPKLYEYVGGSFIDVTAKAGFDKTGFPNSVTASDLNGDGWTDLFVANDFYVGDWYYINNGDGTFSDKVQEYLPHTSFSSMGVDAADINNDGRLDMGVVDMVAEDNYRQKANMSGMNPKAFWKVVAEGGHHQYMFNMLHLNNGGGQFSDIAQLGNVASTDWSWSILMADLDNDGWKDIFITNGLRRDIRNKDASKAFPKYLEAEIYKFIQENPGAENTGVWDIVDIKKALDLIPSEKLTNYVFKNNGDLTFSKQVEDWGFDQKTFSNGSAYADLDNDGDLDLVVNNINDAASVYENHATDHFNKHFIRIQALADHKKVIAEGTKIWIKTGKTQQFFEITGVRGMYSTSEQIAHFGLGKNTSVDEIIVRWPDGKENKLTNVKADQSLLVKYSDAQLPKKSKPIATTIFQKVNQSIGLNHQHLENKFDDYVTQVLLPHKMSTLGPCLATGDVNKDGLEDFYIGGAIGNPGTLYQQNPNGSFAKITTEAFIIDKKREDLGALFFDADNDSDLDLYVVSGGNEYLKGAAAYQDRLYLNNGSGSFSKGENVLPALAFSGSKVRAEDFDRDGDVDLFVAGRHIPWAYPEPASSVLLQNDNGKFKTVTQELAPQLKDIGMVNDAQWLDYNNDGWKDLVLVGEWMSLTVFENRKGQFTKQENLLDKNTSGWWFSVETADMDGDGDEDIIAGNLGLNYKYKATIKEPFEVYYYDFDQNKSKDIVLTYYNFGIQYPLRGKQCSSEQIPTLNEQFASYDLFATADVSNVYGESNLDSALHYQATTFASTYFENKGNGNFEAHPLPILAQLSSINDMVIDDFNGDTHLDILVAGNLYNAEVETARNDAGYGLLLAGNGKGDFEAIDRIQSGFFVPYNVKSMVPLKHKNGDLILVACNDDLLQIYQH